MKKTTVVVPWDQGLHLRSASKLVHLAHQYRSAIQLSAHGKMADARSIINIMLLCATFGSVLEVEIAGDDETSATEAIELLFNPAIDDHEPSGGE